MSASSFLSPSLRFASVAALVAASVGCSARDQRAIAELTPELEPVVQGNNAFAVQLYKKAAAKPGNLFFSPFSVSAAFGMTYAGARADTAAEMRQVLALQGEDAAYHTNFGALIADLGGVHDGRGYELRIANKLFGQMDLAFEQPFLDITSKAYAAPLDRLDYVADPEVARAAVNKWVAEQTEDKIPELFKSGEIDATTKLTLANAIYFHADWKLQFEESRTQTSGFTREDGSVVDVTLMAQTGEFRSAFREDVGVAEMNYADDELSMVLIVPQGNHKLSEIEASLDGAKLDALLGELGEPHEMSISLPRFKLSARLPLEELLGDLGMNLAFDPEKADFTGIAANAGGNLYLQAAVHQAFIQVDEAGTEAAAATGVSSGALSSPPELYANRPFMFVIRDRLTTSVLFAGRVEDPTGITF